MVQMNILLVKITISDRYIIELSENIRRRTDTGLRQRGFVSNCGRSLAFFATINTENYDLLKLGKPVHYRSTLENESEFLITHFTFVWLTCARISYDLNVSHCLS